MRSSNIDYTNYTIEELLDCKENIDREVHPEKYKEIELLIKDRLRQQNSGKVQKVSISDEDGNIAAIKLGRAPSFGRGISEIVGGVLFGLIWINISSTNESAPEYWGLIGYFVIVSSVVGGFYHIYNAFSKNRFTQQDIVAPNKEKDPFESMLGLNEKTSQVEERNSSSRSPRKYVGDYCPFCRSKVEDSFDFCPSCGKDI